MKSIGPIASLLVYWIALRIRILESISIALSAGILKNVGAKDILDLSALRFNLLGGTAHLDPWWIDLSSVVAVKFARRQSDLSFEPILKTPSCCKYLRSSGSLPRHVSMATKSRQDAQAHRTPCRRMPQNATHRIQMKAKAVSCFLFSIAKSRRVSALGWTKLKGWRSVLLYNDDWRLTGSQSTNINLT